MIVMETVLQTVPDQEGMWNPTAIPLPGSGTHMHDS